MSRSAQESPHHKVTSPSAFQTSTEQNTSKAQFKERLELTTRRTTGKVAFRSYTCAPKRGRSSPTAMAKLRNIKLHASTGDASKNKSILGRVVTITTFNPSAHQHGFRIPGYLRTYLQTASRMLGIFNSCAVGYNTQGTRFLKARCARQRPLAAISEKQQFLFRR